MALNYVISEKVVFQAIYRQREQWHNIVTLTVSTFRNVTKFPFLPGIQCITPRHSFHAMRW